MTLLEIVTEMREATAQHARRTRYRGQEEYLEDKEAHCRRMNQLADELLRRHGTPDRLTMSAGKVAIGRRVVQVDFRRVRRAARG